MKQLAVQNSMPMFPLILVDILNNDKNHLTYVVY